MPFNCANVRIDFIGTSDTQSSLVNRDLEFFERLVDVWSTLQNVAAHVVEFPSQIHRIRNMWIDN